MEIYERLYNNKNVPGFVHLSMFHESFGLVQDSFSGSLNPTSFTKGD